MIPVKPSIYANTKIISRVKLNQRYEIPFCVFPPVIVIIGIPQAPRWTPETLC